MATIVRVRSSSAESTLSGHRCPLLLVYCPEVIRLTTYRCKEFFGRPASTRGSLLEALVGLTCFSGLMLLRLRRF